MPARLLFLLAAASMLAACGPKKVESSPMFGQPETELSPTAYDLPEVQAAGELIAVTLSGPDTYYEYRGQGFGLQFALAEAFAASIGAKLRMEMASDSAQLYAMLNNGEADLIALELDSVTHWPVRSTSPQLAAAIQRWWDPQRRIRLQEAEKERWQHPVRTSRSLRPPMLSRKDGIISAYDAHFIRSSRLIGWDWRLMAAQCYQESGFDPHAVSWAGAQGLMQIMPATAAHLGLARHDVFDPASNIQAAARYLSELSALFADIPSRAERICFILAAYNGGPGHVRDAMNLTSKYGGNPHHWADVDTYILRLAEPRYYRDPLVRNGYLRGSETSAYVRQIMARWASYRGSARAMAPAPVPTKNQGPSSRAHRKWIQKDHHIRPRSAFMPDSIK